MSDRTSKTILEADKILQERRKQKGLDVTPYNYDTNADITLTIDRSKEASVEKIQENNKVLLEHALEANAPQVSKEQKNDEKIVTSSIKPVTIDTSAIPSQEKTTAKELGDEDEKNGDER